MGYPKDTYRYPIVSFGPPGFVWGRIVLQVEGVFFLGVTLRRVGAVLQFLHSSPTVASWIGKTKARGLFPPTSAQRPRGMLRVPPEFPRFLPQE